jgi:uncharacterized protein (TIGR00725 family)
MGGGLGSIADYVTLYVVQVREQLGSILTRPFHASMWQNAAPRMIKWPTELWGPPATEADTDRLQRARDKAVARVLELRKGRPIVAVSGYGKEHAYADQAKELGELLSRLNFTMTNGGLKGVMSDVTEGFLNSRGLGSAIRIIPEGKDAEAKEVGNRLPGAIPVYTNLPGNDKYNRHKGPSSRNHVLIVTADGVICMPGESGSIAEAELAVEVYKKRVIAYAPSDEGYKEWHTAIKRLKIALVREGKELEGWLSKLH